jgi:hypothetical protein
MQPLVQSAIDAANRGENNKAIEFIKQALAANPNDVDAWLVLAAVVEEPERKRQCLNRVLTLDPTNEIARDELLDMDRAAMGGIPSSFFQEPAQSEPQATYLSAPPPPDYPTSTSAFEPEPDPLSRLSSPSAAHPASMSAFESAPAAAQPKAKATPKSSSQARIEKPLVFKYPLFWRLLMYFTLALFACVGLIVAPLDIVKGSLFFLFAFAIGLVILALSPKVEITQAGIRASTVFSSSEAKWNDIKRIQSSGMSQRLDLYKSNGQVVKVSAQVSGYPRIVEIIRQKRPDLFGAVVSPAGQGNQIASNSYSGAVSAPAFTGTKLFKKSVLMQYGGFLVYIPLCLISFWTVLTDPENQIVALLVGIACGVMMVLSIFQVNGVKVEPNKLTVQTLFGEKDFSAREIREIKMQSVRRRYGNVTTYVVVTSIQGKKYSLAGFSDGTEIIYGFLTNWWNAYQNRSL